MAESVPILDTVARILLAVTLGAAVELERQWRLRTAGIRTNALVSVGAALFNDDAVQAFVLEVVASEGEGRTGSGEGEGESHRHRPHSSRRRRP